MNHPQPSTRQGVVAVEFAVVAPVLLALMLGIIEMNKMYDAQNLLATAAREGARFASMDRDGLVPEDMTTNQKMTQDIKTFLESNGIDPDGVTVEVKDHEQPTEDFDIDDPDNDLRLFEVQVSVDYSSVSYASVDAGSDYALVGKVVFRNGRATISN